MSGCACVLRGVLVGGVVAAESHTARLTSAQMDPACADLYALFAFTFLGLLYCGDCSNVGTGGVGSHAQLHFGD